MKKQLQTILTTHKMKQQSIFTRLQTQYNKLTQLLQTKGSQFSQFKYQQILNRISRCGLQMKRLGMGMGVCLALGVGTPVMGQTPVFLKKANAMTTSGVEYFREFNFVDIDNDGDYDVFCDSLYSAPATAQARKTLYYENTGGASNAIFVKRFGSANPLNNAKNVAKPTFVDIDNDGDLDCFVGHAYGVNNAVNYTYGRLTYYQNQGTSSSPNFVLLSGLNNPLDSINNSNGFSPTVYPSFVDIDNDADMDFFTGERSSTSEVVFFENIGTVSNPLFARKMPNENPLDTVTNSLAINSVFPELDIEFWDMDGDNDKDAFVIGDFTNASNVYDRFRYFENIGTASNPSFVWSMSTPFDLIGNIDSTFMLKIVDIDDDGDLDVYTKVGPAIAALKEYYENQDTVTSIFTLKEEISMEIYPNPTTGIIHFEKAITGYMSVYNAVGQRLWGKELYEEQKIELLEMANGIYFFRIETDEEYVYKKILIAK